MQTLGKIRLSTNPLRALELYPGAKLFTVSNVSGYFAAVVDQGALYPFG